MATSQSMCTASLRIEFVTLHTTNAGAHTDYYITLAGAIVLTKIITYPISMLDKFEQLSLAITNNSQDLIKYFKIVIKNITYDVLKFRANRYG